MTTSLNRDANYVAVGGGVYDDGSNVIAPLLINASTGRLKVTATIGSITPGSFGTWYNVSGTINGSNVTFTIPISPVGQGILFLARQPQMPNMGATTWDYSISGNTITYTTAPDGSLAGQPHLFFSTP